LREATAYPLDVMEEEATMRNIRETEERVRRGEYKYPEDWKDRD